MITTYDSNCMKCLNGMIHPWHDNGEPAEVLEADDKFSQLPPESDPLRYVTPCPNGCECRKRHGEK